MFQRAGVNTDWTHSVFTGRRQSTLAEVYRGVAFFMNSKPNEHLSLWNDSLHLWNL